MLERQVAKARAFINKQLEELNLLAKRIGQLLRIINAAQRF